MKNNFFCKGELSRKDITERLMRLENAKVGFYSIGQYPACLAYNCAMQTDGSNLILSTRPNRELFGAFSQDTLKGMDSKHLDTMHKMGSHLEGNRMVPNTLSDLILRCEIVILSANSNHIENDLNLAIELRKSLMRTDVVLACLSGSFSHDVKKNESYVLCEKEPNLAFFSGFHRHGALLNPLDSFTANFCHPDALTAMLGAKILDKLSPNIQVSSGVHNLEGQYIKAAKNMSSIFAGFAHDYHMANPGLLPTVLTLLLDQCLDQAACVSMCRKDRDKLYNHQPFPLTELGYGVQKIEAALQKDGDMKKVRDHTFSQLTAMVADVRGSMMHPNGGKPTRNFQAGQILSKNMRNYKRCPKDLNEYIEWCTSNGLQKGSLEGVKSLQYWPQIIKKYSLQYHDSSMVNLLYFCIFGSKNIKALVYIVLTQSRELTNYCQESVRPTHSRCYAEALNNISSNNSLDLFVQCLLTGNNSNKLPDQCQSYLSTVNSKSPAYLQTMYIIEKTLTSLT